MSRPQTLRFQNVEISRPGAVRAHCATRRKTPPDIDIFPVNSADRETLSRKRYRSGTHPRRWHCSASRGCRQRAAGASRLVDHPCEPPQLIVAEWGNRGLRNSINKSHFVASVPSPCGWTWAVRPGHSHGGVAFLIGRNTNRNSRASADDEAQTEFGDSSGRESGFINLCR